MRLRRGGPLHPIDRVLLNSPSIAEGWNVFIGAVRTATSVPAQLRELVILRVAELNGADYEWTAHEPIGQAAGLTDADLAALRVGGDLSSLSAVQQVVVAFTDALTRTAAVPDSIFVDVQELFDDRQIMELTATVGAYNMVSRVLVALHVGTED